jgi:hypothetical protein
LDNANQVFMNEIFNQFSDAIIPHSNDDEAIEEDKIDTESSPKSMSMSKQIYLLC